MFKGLFTGSEYANVLNRKQIGSMDLRKSVKRFWIHWNNEDSEWQEEFVKTIKPEIMVYILNHKG